MFGKKPCSKLLSEFWNPDGTTSGIEIEEKGSHANARNMPDDGMSMELWTVT
jgi:hypothetical protein